MSRTALVRSASLAPEEADLVDRLAGQVANGSFTELTRRLLRVFGAPLSRRLDELQSAGVDPQEQLALLSPSAPSTTAELVEFYAPSTWPERGPQAPPD